MNNPVRTTRRAALVGALVSTAALAAATLLPVSAAAVAVSTLPDLIRAHQKAWRQLSALSRASGDLDDKVKIPAARVVVGEMLDFVNNTRHPLSVVSYGELEHHAARHIPSNVRAAWLSDKRAELRAAIRRKRYAENKAGVTALNAKLRAAVKAEERARIALVLARPATSAEASRKAAYIARSTPFREGWCEDSASFLAGMFAGLGEVA